MLQKRIIPCLDVTEGRVVKGTNFINLRDAGDPVELAAFYDREGADELVFLDITASAEGRKTTVEMVYRTAGEVFIPFTVGGGISTLEDIRFILSAGADKVSINTAAVKDPQLVTEAANRFGSQCIVVAIDARQRGPESWEVYIHGGRTPTGIDAVEWAKKAEFLGAGEILLTSMDRDGTKDGYEPATKTSAETAAVTSLTFSTTPVPTISGTAKVGATLTAKPGTWLPTPDTLRYAWSRSGTVIENATGGTYQLAPADAGKAITVTGRPGSISRRSERRRETDVWSATITSCGGNV